jgi:hypothetical protein
VDDRPYTEHGVINFSLQDGIPISDLSSNGPAAAGGDNGRGIDLTRIDLPPAPLDLSGGSKVSCASTAPIPSRDEDSESESTDSDDDMLARITQGLAKGLRIQVALNGFFSGYQNIDSIVTFRQPYSGPPPDSLRTAFNYAFSPIALLPPTFESNGFPNSLNWAICAFTDAYITATLTKSNDGLCLTFHRQGMPGLPIVEFPASYTLKVPTGLRISFGTENCPSDETLTRYLALATAPMTSDDYGKLWKILLMAQPWRDSETGEISVIASNTYPQDVGPRSANPIVPRNAAKSPCYTYTTRRK